jgi:glycosyltransferase involved in cell wall biosynthesis
MRRSSQNVEADGGMIRPRRAPVPSGVEELHMTASVQLSEEPRLKSPANDGAIELTILMPCLNEAETIGTCVAKARRFLASAGVDGEVLVADNGSTDGSLRIAHDLGARVIEVPERGYGAALRAGIAAARGTFVIMGDADDSYDFLALQPFLDELRAGRDLVMGNRFKGGVAPGAMPALHRYLGNPVLSFVGRLFFRSGIGDFHCGLRGFRREAIVGLDLHTSGMEFASEMVVRATLSHLDISEVPTTLRPDGRSRAPHLRSWRDGWRHLRFLLLFSPRWLFLYPGIVLSLFGGLGVAVLAFRPIWILDVNTMVVCSAAMYIGYQSIWFAILSKAFASREGLLPHDERIERFRMRFRLERTLLVAGLLTVLGIGGLVVAFARWDFAPQNPRDSLRIVLPAVTVLVIGVQTALSSLLLSILGLPSSRPAVERPSEAIDLESVAVGSRR